MTDNKKILVVGHGMELSALKEKLNLDAKDIIVVDDVNEVLKGEFDKEVTYKFTKPAKLHEANPWVGDMTKKQINAPEMEPVRSTPKIQNNEPCPCGSGKKYKKCCK